MGQAATHNFVVDGMHCASCPMLIDETLEDLDGVQQAATNLRTGRATVRIDPARCTPDEVIAAIAGAGYAARIELP